MVFCFSRSRLDHGERQSFERTIFLGFIKQTSTLRTITTYRDVYNVGAIAKQVDPRSTAVSKGSAEIARRKPQWKFSGIVRFVGYGMLDL